MSTTFQARTMYSKFNLLAAIISATSLSLSTVHAFDDNAARSKSVYQVVTDRFALTDTSSSRSCDTSDMVYCGGTWKGTEEKLDYIQGMGFDTVWISPVVQNINVTNNKLGEAYHGYWTQDINELNSHFGSEADLKSLVTAAHKKNMYIMVDVVSRVICVAIKCRLSALSSRLSTMSLQLRQETSRRTPPTALSTLPLETSTHSAGYRTTQTKHR